MQLFKKILVVVDTSQEDHPELDRAILLANQSEAELYLVDVVRDAGLTIRLLSKDYAHLHELLLKERREALQKLIDQCRSHSLSASGEVLEGVSSRVTIDAAKHVNADLIIRTSRGANSLTGGQLGTSAQRLIRHLPCPTLLTNPNAGQDCKTIVAAVDATPNDQSHAELNRKILTTAQELSKCERCRLLVAYAWNLYGAEMLEHRLPESEYQALIDHNKKLHQVSFEALLSEFGLHATSVDSRMLEGEPSNAIPKLCEAESADLLVCGTVARYGISGLLLGNTAERIMNRVECSVLALTPDQVSIR